MNSKEKAFQDYFPGNDCFGCGLANEIGLRVKSYWFDERKNETICVWRPQRFYSSGMENVLHGGTIGDLVDCNGVWAIMAHHYSVIGRELGTEPVIWYATRYFETDLPKKTPMDDVILVRSQVIEITERKGTALMRIWAGGRECARGKVVAVRIELTKEEIAKFLNKENPAI